MPISFLKNPFNKKRITNMEKEIYSQPDIISFLIEKYIKKENCIDITLPDDIKKIALIASGSSYHGAAAAADFLRQNALCDAQVFYAGELSLLNSIDVDLNTLYIFISQSGETADTNTALEKITVKTDKTLAVTNTENSILYNNSKYKVLAFAGAEKSIVSTKAVCAQLFCLFLISVKIMQSRGLQAEDILNDLIKVPLCIKKVFDKREEIIKYSKLLSKYDNAIILASGMFYSLAKEAALKIKETSYINASAYPAGEFPHGHIAVLNKKCAVIYFVNNRNIDFSLNLLNKINTEYKKETLIISAAPFCCFQNADVINLSALSDINFMFAVLVLQQILALETASILKRNIDKPKGLSKIVK